MYKKSIIKYLRKVSFILKRLNVIMIMYGLGWYGATIQIGHLLQNEGFTK